MIDPPTFLALDPTGLCNFRCRTCVLDTHFPHPVLLDPPLLESLAEVLPGLDGMALGCDAEPTLHPRIAEIVAWCRARTSGEIMMITNGSRLAEGQAEPLLSAGLDSLSVSLDGATAETFEAVRRGASFAVVERNLRWVAARSARGEAPALRLIFTTTRRNVAELPDVISLAAELGIDSVSVNGFEPYTVEERDERLWRRPGETLELDEVEAAHDRARRIAADSGIELKLPELEAVEQRSCPFATPVVGPTGDVAPCPALSYARDVPLEHGAVRYPRLVVGNLADDSFETIWARPDYVAFREQAAGGLTHDACRRCLVATGAICARQ